MLYCEIVKRLKDPRRGIPAIPTGYMSSDEYENPYWDLFFLSDLGFSAADLDLEKEIDGFLDTQASDGTFITEYGMQPSYHCKSAILLSSIARMGYQNDEHVKAYVRLFLSSQRLDGGWYCNPNHDIGAPLQDEPSCPQENLNILLLLGQYDSYRNDPRFNGAIDLLLNHWAIRHTGARIVYFGVGRRYQKLLYPLPDMVFCGVLDAVSLYPYAIKKPAFHNMLDFVRQKAVDGRYPVEVPGYYTNLEPREKASRLLTFIFNRIEKRVKNT